jgi:phosphatidylserine/phosphatidylglycerophosphate/cardiolipin synthase-like enzyme
MPNALAFSNNDLAVFAWSFDRQLDECQGFAVYRGDVHAGTWEAMPALARFAGVPADAKQTTEQAPVQKFWWKDLEARHGGLYHYKIVPMGGRPGALTPLARVEPLITNPVAITADRGLFKAWFTRGILATQAVARVLGTPSADRLMRHIQDPNDKLRQLLEGQLQDALTSLLDSADATGGEVRCALYELNDPDVLEKRLQAADHGNPKARAVVLGNETVAANRKTGAPAEPDKYKADRDKLKEAGVPVIDRILPVGHIPHNKFVVLKQSDAPVSVLTGSTNWTMNALAAQTNNALLIESPSVAAHFSAFWDELERDSADSNPTWQGPDLRKWIANHNAAMLQSPIKLEDQSADIQVFFSPSTVHALAKPPKEHPADLEYLFGLMKSAKQAVLFLAFEPGNNSILEAAAKALAANKNLFVRGTLTSATGATQFKDALDADSTEAEGSGKHPSVATIGEPAPDKRQGVPDFRDIPATAVHDNDKFGAWAVELNKAGFAIVHDKIVVIDPFSDDCVVVTGSHNLGYRASHNNDENMVVVKGHRSLAEAYACHVLDVYDHYAWRWLLSQHPMEFGKPLDSTGAWQARYIKDGTAVSAELNFWMNAQPNVRAHAATATREATQPAHGVRPANGRDRQR